MITDFDTINRLSARDRYRAARADEARALATRWARRPHSAQLHAQVLDYLTNLAPAEPPAATARPHHRIRVHLHLAGRGAHRAEAAR